MNPDPPKREYDVSEAPFEVSEQNAARPGAVVDAEAEGEAEKRRQDAALASTFDPALAKSGKTDEEIDKQKHDEALLVGGAAIIGVAIVAHEIHDHQHGGELTHDDAHTGHDAHHDGGDT